MPGDDAGDGAPLVEPRGVGGDVRGALHAGGVLELHVGELAGDVDGGVHEAERGGEDQLVPRPGQLADHPLGIGAFGHVLHIGGLDLVAEMRLDRLPALVVLVAPAEVADGADIDEPDLDRVLLRRRRRRGRAPPGPRSGFVVMRISLSLCCGCEVFQPVRWNTRPRLAGAFSEARVRSADMMTSTIMVTR